MAAALAWTFVAGAAPIITTDWNDAGTDNWAVRDHFGVQTTILDGDPAPLTDWLRITGDPGVGNTGDAEIYNNSDLVGNYNGLPEGVARSIHLSFYANTAPGTLQLYLVANGHYWYYNLNVSSGWQNFAINLYDRTDDSGWFGPGLTYSDFATDLNSVTEIGFYLTYNTTAGPQTYGVENFILDDQYVVPEPSTYAMLGISFLSMALIFRRKLREGLATATVALSRA
jgi:hypothetical protein